MISRQYCFDVSVLAAAQSKRDGQELRSGMRLLDDELRWRLIEEVRTAIHHSGGTLTLPQSTELCLARRPADFTGLDSPDL